jgi:hypothetical protein
MSRSSLRLPDIRPSQARDKSGGEAEETLDLAEEGNNMGVAGAEVTDRGVDATRPA